LYNTQLIKKEQPTQTILVGEWSNLDAGQTPTPVQERKRPSLFPHQPTHLHSIFFQKKGNLSVASTT